MRVGLVTTGGTIAGTLLHGVVRRTDRSSTALTTWTAGVGADVTLVARSPVDSMSENMDSSAWVTIADTVRTLVREHDLDGVLVLHGTDTMALTGAALAFLCADIDRPILVTGANVPAASPASDASTNVSGAITAIAHLERGCYLSFAGTPGGDSHVIAATRSRKSYSRGQAFRSVGAPLIATVTGGGEWLPVEDAPRLPGPCRPNEVHMGMDGRSSLIQVHPGLDFLGLRRMVEAADIRAVVFQLFPSLTAPARIGRFDCPEFTRWATEAEILVVGCPSEPSAVVGSAYESTVALHDAGMVVAATALPEVAWVKACWACSAADGLPARRERFLGRVDIEFLDTPA